MKALTADARAQTSGRLWQGLEWVPVAGANLRAVREGRIQLVVATPPVCSKCR